MPWVRKPLSERFWSYVTPDDPNQCWIWSGSKDTRGYGRIRVFDESRNKWVFIGAHRLSWSFANGRIPEGKVICHKCDIPDCVNPNHLFIGSQADNLRDMAEKGRLNKSGLALGPIHSPVTKKRFKR